MRWLSVIAFALSTYLVSEAGSGGKEARDPFADKLELQGPPGPLVKVRFSSSGKYLACTNVEDIAVWSMGARVRRLVLKRRQPPIWDFEFSKDDRELVFSSSEGLFAIDLATQKLSRADPRKMGVGAVAVSPNGKLLAISWENNYIEIRQMKSRKLVMILKGHAAHVTTLAWSSDSRMLASGAPSNADALDSTVRLWDIDKKSEVHSFTDLVRQQGFPDSLFFVGDKALLAGCKRERVVLWELAARKVKAELADPELDGQFFSFAYERSGILAIACLDEIRFVQLPEGKELGRWNAPRFVGSLAFTPDGKSLAVDYGSITGRTGDRANAGLIHIVPFSKSAFK